MSVIRDYIGVRSRPTVVRLSDLSDPGAEWISSCFALTTDVGAHLDSIRKTLKAPSGSGAFLIGGYGSGKSHFLAYLAQSIRSGDFLDTGNTPEVLAVSLLNYRSELSLEGILCKETGIDGSAEDRREAWAELSRRCPQGALLIIDELSEFLRAKPSSAAFNEDVRFLQFLGEWAQTHSFWVLAAMQEQIEHTGELESALYRKIKDRFPLRLLLGTAHLRELVCQGVLERRSGAREAIEDIIRQGREALPQANIDYSAFAELYPIHPLTLDFLEEVRDLFSQARGAVEFVLRQLEGDPVRSIEAFLDRPLGEVLTPERIVDHFADLFEVQADFLPIAQKFLPWYRRHERQLLPTPAMRETGWRILKLLVLVYISPQREGLSVDEATEWLLVRISSISPEANRRVVEKLLGVFVAKGRFVIEREGRYFLDFGDDSAEKLQSLLRRELAELGAAGEEAIWEILTPLLEGEGFGIFDLPANRWQQRCLRWHFHSREFVLFFGNAEVPDAEGAALVIRLPWGNAGAAAGFPTLIPSRRPLSPEFRELAALVRLKERALEPQLESLVDSKIHAARRPLGEFIRRAYADASLEGVPGAGLPAIRLYSSTVLQRWLETWGIWLLRRRYPGFEDFAPVYGPLPKEAYRRFMRAAAANDPDRFEGEEYLKLIREAYLVPMGLMRRKGGSYEVLPKLEKHDLVAIVLSMVKHQPRPKLIYERLAAPIYGLVPDQIHLLLLFLVLQGEIDLLKAGRSYRELFETMPLPIHYDQVVVGRGLSAEELKKLETLSDAFKLRRPTQWTPGAQRTMVSRIAQRLDALVVNLTPLAEKLSRFEEGSALKERVDLFLNRCTSINKGKDLFEGLEHLLYEIGSPSAFMAEARELQEWPLRLDAALGELRRLKHLVAHPALGICRDPELRSRIEALGSPPGLEDFELLEEWMAEARTAYEVYASFYREAHERWLPKIEKDELWSWTPPQLCASSHIGLDEEARAFRERLARAAELRCRGLSDLNYQPQCSCGFDGISAPIADELVELRRIRDRITKSLRLFFSRSEVRERVAEWHRQGVEKSPATLDYIKGRAELPEIADPDLLDRHLSGMELFATVDLGAITSKLEDRSWRAEDLVEAIAGEIRRTRSPRIRLASNSIDEGRKEILRWCLEQSLRVGVRLPRAFSTRELDPFAQEIDSGWIGSPALADLEALGLGAEIEDRIIRMILDGGVEVPTGEIHSPLMRACVDLIRPSQPRDPEGLADLAARLYRRSRRLAAVAGSLWLERLEEVAHLSLGADIPTLQSVLEGAEGKQWLVIDCMGAVLLKALAPTFARGLASWRRDSLHFAMGGKTSTTDAWLSQLAEAGISHPLEKINVLDRLIHESTEEFEALCRLAAAQLENALRKVSINLDETRPLLVFADHGFRLAKDGRRWVHGGASTLERLIPIIEMAPRS